MSEDAKELGGGGDSPINVGVSVDGSWQRRGFSSLNGVVTAISIDSGKIVDTEIESKLQSMHVNGTCKKVIHCVMKFGMPITYAP